MGNAHCWKGWREWAEESFGPSWSHQYIAAEVEKWGRQTEWDDASWPDATCLLMDGHPGDHVWTPDDRVVIRLASSGAL